MTAPTVIYLTKAREIPSPLESFQQLSNDFQVILQNQGASINNNPDELKQYQQDMYGDFNQTSSTSLIRKFEANVSNLCQMEDGLFTISGVMAQEIALSIYSQQSNSRYFLCHETSHLLLHEQNGYQELLHLIPRIIPLKKNTLQQSPLTADEIIQTIQNNSQPGVVVIECPHRELGGKITSWDDLIKISEYCHQHGIALHLDGARLWEATVAYNKSLSEICSLFDSVYVSFYKGLGGMTGAMLLGKSSFITQARIWLRRFGGNIFTSLPYVVSAWSGLIRNVNSFEERTTRMRSIAQLLTTLFQQNGSAADQQLIRFDPEIPVVSLVHVYLRGAPSDILLQIRDRVIQEVSISCFSMIRSSKKTIISELNGNETVVEESYFEFNIGPHNLHFSDELWYQGWELFQKYLREYVASVA